jgi:hypothetical protein
MKMSKPDALIIAALGPDAISFEYEIGGVTRTGWKIHLLQKPNDFSLAGRDLIDKWWRQLQERDIRLFNGGSIWQISENQFANSLEAVEFDSAEGPPPLRDPSSFPPTCSQIFAMPGLPTLDIVEFAKTGSHNADQIPFDDVWGSFSQRIMKIEPESAPLLRESADKMRRQFSRMHSPEPWRAVQENLSEIMKIAPFTIQFADAAGLHATLLQPVSREQAKHIGNLITDVDPEAMELPISDLKEFGMDVPMDSENPDIPDYEEAMIQYIVAAKRFRMWWD